MIGLNHYSEILNYIKEVALEDELVNGVTQGNIDEVDFDKTNPRPLVHISINKAVIGSSIVEMSVQIGALSDRIENKKINNKDYFKNDNEVDNMNTTLAILNRLWGKMNLGFHNADIIASTSPSLEPVEDKLNKLDGWVISFDLEMPNTSLNLCKECN